MNRSRVPNDSLQVPGWPRRLGSLLYDALTFTALWLLAAALFTSIAGEALPGWSRGLLQGASIALIAAYFTWCWSHGGQTLAMRTWRLRLVMRGGASVRMSRALLRFLLAIPSVGFAGIGLAWALFDRDRQYLHDRLAGTQLLRS